MEVNVKSPSYRPYSRQCVTTNQDKWSLSQRAQSDWSLRLQREFKYIKSLSNGIVFFATFTFDDEHLKYLDNYSDGWYYKVYHENGHPKVERKYYMDYLHDDGERVKVFDNELLSENVFRSLRQVFGLKFKYVVFPEYGSSKTYVDKYGRLRVGTKRPHYHVLIFVEDYNLIFPYIYTDSHNKVHIFDSFHDILLFLYGACESQCLDLAVISDDFGFSKYVSKYVSKGIQEEVFPPAFLYRVKVARKVIRDLRPFNYDMLKDEFRKALDDSISFLNWFEKHRPKLLCSNGIGASIPYSSDELYEGCVQVFNGKKYVDVMIPRYNIRKYCYSLEKHLVRKHWCIKDGLVKVFPNAETYAYHWDLKYDKKDVLIHHDELSLTHLRDKLFNIFNLSGSFPPAFKEYISKHSMYEFNYRSFDELTLELRSDIEKLFKSVDFPLLLHYYRRFFSCYCCEHLYYHFGVEIPHFCDSLDTDSSLDLVSLSKEANVFIQVGNFLSDAIYTSAKFSECPSRYSDFTLFRESYKCISVLYEIDSRIRLISDAYNYCEYLRRKNDFEKLRNYNKLLRGYNVTSSS